MENKRELTLVTFGQAKKLKELGFDYPCNVVYYYNKNAKPFDRGFAYYNETENIIYSAPSIPLVFRWLRNEKGIIAMVKYDKDGEYFEYAIYKQEIILYSTFGTCDYYKEYEQAELEALNKSLELLP